MSAATTEPIFSSDTAALLAQAAHQMRGGFLTQAEDRLRALLVLDPDHPEALCLMGDVLLRTGRYDTAVRFFEKGIERRSGNPEAHVGLGNAWFQLKAFGAAAIQYRRALALRPDFPEAGHNLASTLHALGRSTEAIKELERILDRNPGWPVGHATLGRLLLAAGRLADATRCLRRALELQPDSAALLSDLAGALKGQGERREAEDCARRAIALKPDFVEPLNTLGTLLLSSGRHEEAAAAFERAIAIDATRPELHNNLGNALKERGDLEGARACYQQSLALRPDFAPAHSNLGNALQDLRRFDEAYTSYRRAVEIDPRFDVAWSNLGNAARELGRLQEAEEVYRQSLALNPGNAEALNNLANVLKDDGRLEEALACLHRALALKPDFRTAYHNLLMIMQYDPTIPPGQLLEAHREFDRRFAAPLAALRRPHRNAPDPERRLRLGYVSGDFGRHPVGYFMMPVFPAHDRGQVELFAYSDRLGSDEITDALRAGCDHWCRIGDLDEASFAERVAADGIDILVDLSGHTPRNRLLAFALKPAPVQVTWAGYAGTTGMSAIDGLISDAEETPPGAEGENVEETLRLPQGYVCYGPPAYAPEVGPLPALEAGHLTFGCFNNLAKINGPVVALWARLLQRLPEARLVLKTLQLDEPRLRERLADRFAGQGVDPARVSLLGRSRHPGLLATYNQIDIALDPFPYSGGLTTLESLWMGVPVVTKRGDRFAGRHSSSHLTTVGLPALVARDADEYLEIACGLAGDLGRLAALRRELRPRMAASPLCDGPRFVRGLESVYRRLWRRWCASNPPETLFRRPSAPTSHRRD
jgi:predicted O-linked N-acetylglucosamine transferase (SPINDLY family)